jgi:hypothetical protein
MKSFGNMLRFVVSARATASSAISTSGRRGWRPATAGSPRGSRPWSLISRGARVLDDLRREIAVLKAGRGQFGCEMFVLERV